MQELSSIEQIISEFGSLPNNYELVEVVGRGGSGVVVRARETFTRRETAIKILFKDRKSSPESVERFAREARVLASLDHPHIVKIFISGVTGLGHQFHVMEWLEGRSLAEHLQESGILPCETFLQLSIQLLSALRYAHALNVVHRDVKPSNIMLCRDADIACLSKLVDFGIARQVDENDEITREGKLLGTPLYMSPEQCAGARQTATSDIYSLACVLHQCLTGHPPFEGDTALEIMYKHLHEEPSVLSLPYGGEDLSELLRGCLHKKPSARPDAAAVLSRFEEMYAGLSGEISSLVIQEKSRKSSAYLVAAFALAVVVVLCASFVVTKTATESLKKTNKPVVRRPEKEEKIADLSWRINRAELRHTRAKSAEERLSAAQELAGLYGQRGESFVGKANEKEGPLKASLADFRRMLVCAAEFDPAEKTDVTTQALIKIAATEDALFLFESAIEHYNRALAAARRGGLLSQQTDVLSSRALLFLRVDRRKESEADARLTVRLWTALADATPFKHIISDNLQNKRKEPEANEKAIQQCRTLTEYCRSYPSAYVEQRLLTLRELLIYTRFLLDQKSDYVLESAGYIDKLCTELSEHVPPALKNEAYSLAAKCAALSGDRAKESRYKACALNSP